MVASADISLTIELPEQLLRNVSAGIADNFGRWLRFIGHLPGVPIELQVIDVPTSYGTKSRFAHARLHAEACRLLDEAEKMGAPGVYAIINDVDPAVATRAASGHWHDAKKGQATTDRDIPSRATLFVDVDAKRVRGTSATDEEIARTAEVATAVYTKLAGLVGANALGYGSSGNGRSVFVALDHIPESPELENLVKGLLAGLGMMFAAPRVEIDPVVSDAKRLGPAWGTTKRKGAAAVAERPHRRTAFVCADNVRRLTFEELRSLLDSIRSELAGEQQAKVDHAMGIRSSDRPSRSTGSSGPAPNDPFGRANAVSVADVAEWLGVVDGDGVHCPGCGAHGDSSVVLLHHGLKCSHASCARRGRDGFRTNVDLVAEVRNVTPREAVTLLADHFHFDGFRARSVMTPEEARAARENDDDEAEGTSEIAPVRPAPPSPIIERWGPFDPALLSVVPPPRRWLLRHPTRDGAPCAPGDGDGLLPASKVGAILAEGGAGKTMVAVSLAVALVTGRRWLGHFDVDREAMSGKILLGLAEEDAEEIHRRFYQAAKQYELDTAERAKVASQIVALPLAGMPVPLIAYGDDGRTLVDSSHLLALREMLTRDAGPHGWSLILLDPLARWAGPDVEADNSVATRFVQTLETLNAVPGRPFVLLNHHSSKAARRAGSVDSRGVTAITDAMRWTFEMRAEGGDVLVRQAKSNYSIPMAEELRLVRGPGGLLRVPTESEQRARDARKADKEAEVDDRTEAKIAALMEAIVAALRIAKARPTSREQLMGLVRGTQGLKVVAVTRLFAEGRIRKSSPSKKGESPAFEVTDGRDK
jgi:hypothetical protein